MITYSSKNLTEYLNSVADEKDISKSELIKNLSINDFSVLRSASLLFGFLNAEKEFKEETKKYNAVVNIKRSFNFGLEYKISATGVKFKKN